MYLIKNFVIRSIIADPRDAEHAAPILANLEENPGLNRHERKGHLGPSAVLDILGKDPYEMIVFDVMHQVPIVLLCVRVPP